MRVIPDSITGVPQCNAPSTTPSGSRLRSFLSLSLRTSSARYRLLRFFPSAASDRIIPPLTYAYNVATLTPSASAARPALRYLSSNRPPHPMSLPATVLQLDSKINIDTHIVSGYAYRRSEEHTSELQ